MLPPSFTIMAIAAAEYAIAALTAGPTRARRRPGPDSIAPIPAQARPRAGWTAAPWR
ncbi:hypothetical protein [Pseudonocardia acidicola]|uniref:Uncharacterized protein n=1 Tax=Pseudonocardia acidicola TaxID=2724939 RepID=A0ABX1SEC8_9PSEU|nr:hypothetical protein [Pseudonocardia acidicola]NMH98701.1 hypothetical protein [Pseudonocardia acidicola]